MSFKNKLPIAISMGEPGGINIEIVLKSIKKKLPNFFLIADPDTKSAFVHRMLEKV